MTVRVGCPIGRRHVGNRGTQRYGAYFPIILRQRGFSGTTMSSQVDEETPLLHSQQVKATPLPWGQFSIILFVQLAEPLTSQVIYPFAPQVSIHLKQQDGF